MTAGLPVIEVCWLQQSSDPSITGKKKAASNKPTPAKKKSESPTSA